MLRPLRDALEGAPGRRLADIGGGTGNYALALRREGWEPTVVDRSAGMLARAAAKGLDTVEADAQEPPFEDESIHPPRASILAELPGARLVEFEFEDMEDGSLAALSADPEHVLTAAERGATSYFERMQRDHPDELRAGIARLRDDIAAGRAPRHAGTATLLGWTKG